MILDTFRDTPDFPFVRYFDDVAQFIKAQEYWLTLLRSAHGFVPADWAPQQRPVDLADDMYTGQVAALENRKTRKTMEIQTLSLDGDINMGLRENGPMDPQHVPDALEPEERDKIIQGTPQDILRADAIAHYRPFMAWVEKGSLWVADPAHPKRGEPVSVETLILTSEISEQTEPLALQALEMFFAEGPAMDRVNAVFATFDQSNSL